MIFHRLFFSFVLLVSTPLYADNKQPIDIGVLLSLSGNWAEICQNIRKGIELAGAEVNEAGGVDGRKLRFHFEDTDEEKSGAKVVTAYKHLRARGIQYFIGPSGVPGILALTPLVKNDSVVLIGPTATNSYHMEADNLFNAGGDNRITTEAIAEYAYQQGVRKVAIFGSQQPWETDQVNHFQRKFAALGGEITATVMPLPDKQDLRVETLKLIKSKPDAVFFAVFNQLSIASRLLKEYTPRSLLSR